LWLLFGADPVKWLPVIGLLWLLAGCAPAAANATPPAPVFLKAAGSTSVAPLMQDLAAAYTQANPQFNLEVQGGGSEFGRRLVAAGQVDFGLVAGPVEPPAAGLRRMPLARDAIAIITHPNNPIAGLSMPELRNIFSGQILNWQAVAGPALDIQVVSREAGSGTRAVFEAAVMGPQPVTPNAVVLPGSQAVVDYVAKNPNAVGYVSFVLAEPGRVHAVPVEGVLPELAAVNAGSYPILRELAVMVAVPESPAVSDFLAFGQSPAGRQIISRRWGKIPLR